jgi:hypothetical protein
MTSWYWNAGNDVQRKQMKVQCAKVVNDIFSVYNRMCIQNKVNLQQLPT